MIRKGEGSIDFVKNVLKRVIGSIPVLIGVILMIFIMLRIIPGDPVTTMLGEHVNEQVIVKITAEMGLDQPLYVQSWKTIDFSPGTIYR